MKNFLQKITARFKNLMNRRFKHTLEEQDGFTLIELMVVVAMIGILSTSAMVVYTTSLSKARDGGRLADISEISTVFNRFYIDTTQFPKLKAEIDSVNGEYINILPTDSRTASGIDYVYAVAVDGLAAEVSALMESTYMQERYASVSNDGGDNDLRVELASGASATTLNTNGEVGDGGFYIKGVAVAVPSS